MPRRNAVSFSFFIWSRPLPFLPRSEPGNTDAHDPLEAVFFQDPGSSRSPGLRSTFTLSSQYNLGKGSIRIVDRPGPDVLVSRKVCV